jgi:spermidine synthase
LACSVVRKSPALHAAERERGLCAKPALSFGQIYALESAGSLLGGAGFSFWAVEHLAPVQIALLCTAVTAAASAAFLIAQAGANAGHGRRRGRPLLPAVLGGVALGAVVVAFVAGDSVERWLAERRWRQLAPGYELVAASESKYQNLALGRRANQFSLYCDGHVTADFPDPYTFAPLAHFWMCEHPRPRQVLVLAGGTEGLLSEILRHPVEHIDCVEPDPRQIELVRPYLPPADRAALSDPRVTVHATDARHFVKTQRARFDLVLARLPEPTSALRARFYTDEFYGELRRAMAPRAVLCLTAAAAPAELSELSREYLACLRRTLGRHFPELIIGWGDPAQVLAATAPGLTTTDPGELSARYARRGVDSPSFDPAWFAGATDWLEPDKLALRAADLDAAGEVSISTDLRPAIYLDRLALWEAAAGSGSGRRDFLHADSWLGKLWAVGVIARLQSIRPVQVAVLLIVLGGMALLAGRWRWGPRNGWAAGAVAVSVASTGFATMALSILWLYAFQNLYGYVYQRLGWIIALFMAGLVLGCTVAGRSHAGFWSWLIRVDVLLAGLAASVPYVWRVLAATQDRPGGFTVVEVCISAMVIATGLLGGAAFALAGSLQLRVCGGPGAAAGTVVWADHAGACLGALLCGILLVPVCGVFATALLLGSVKLVSAGLLWISGGQGWA